MINREIIIAACVIGGLWLLAKRKGAGATQGAGVQATATPETVDADNWLGGWK